jgi:hypothetical protein
MQESMQIDPQNTHAPRSHSRTIKTLEDLVDSSLTDSVDIHRQVGVLKTKKKLLLDKRRKWKLQMKILLAKMNSTEKEIDSVDQIILDLQLNEDNIC